MDQAVPDMQNYNETEMGGGEEGVASAAAVDTDMTGSSARMSPPHDSLAAVAAERPGGASETPTDMMARAVAALHATRSIDFSVYLR